jgi:cell division septation protein DedD
MRLLSGLGGALLAAALTAGCGRGSSDRADELQSGAGTGEERSEVVVLQPASETPGGAADAAVAGSPADAPLPPRRSGARALAEETTDQPAPQADELAIEVRDAGPQQASPAPPAAAPAAPADADDGPSQPVVFDPQGDFTVQIGVFADGPTARKLVRELAADGYPAYALPGGPKGVRVRIGYFGSREEATRFGEIFQRDRHMAYWVDRRQSER